MFFFSPIERTARGTFPISAPSTRCPPFANVAYALAISSGFTASPPSVTEKYPLIGLWMPSRRAMAATACGRTSSVSCAYTVLSEYVVAVSRSTVPRFEPS